MVYVKLKRALNKHGLTDEITNTVRRIFLQIIFCFFVTILVALVNFNYYYIDSNLESRLHGELIRTSTTSTYCRPIVSFQEGCD